MSKKFKPIVVVILGPTASGKSRLAIRLAEKFGGEIISADSRQVYRGLNIGSGKISPAEAASVPHHLLSIVGPKKTFTLADWQARAEKHIKKIQTQGSLPFLVGGTGLYLSSIIDHYRLPQGRPAPTLRRKLENKSNRQLMAQLKKIDPKTAAVIAPENKRRLMRALEFVLSTGQSFVGAQKQGQELSPYDFIIIGLKPDKEELQRLIRQRVQTMMRHGLETEVKRLVQKYGWRVPAMHGIGYREWRAYFDGGTTLADVEAEIMKNTWQYARRQMTWFRGLERKHPIHWVSDVAAAKKILKKFSGREQ